MKKDAKKGKGKKRYQKHNWDIIRHIFVTSEKKLSTRDIGKLFNVNKTNVHNEYKKGQWLRKRKKYWDKLLAKDEFKLGNKFKLDVTNAKGLVSSLIGYILQEIKKKVYEPGTLSSLIGSVDRLVRLQQLLEGKPDSLPGGKSGNIEDILKELDKERQSIHKRITDEDRQLEQTRPVIDAEAKITDVKPEQKKEPKPEEPKPEKPDDSPPAQGLS